MQYKNIMQTRAGNILTYYSFSNSNIAWILKSSSIAFFTTKGSSIIKGVAGLTRRRSEPTARPAGSTLSDLSKTDPGSADSSTRPAFNLVEDTSSSISPDLVYSHSGHGLTSDINMSLAGVEDNLKFDIPGVSVGELSGIQNTVNSIFANRLLLSGILHLPNSWGKILLLQILG